METLLKKALQEVDVDYLQIVIEERKQTQIEYSGPQLEEIGTSSSRGGNVRACHRGGWGFVSFTDTSNLKGYVRDACRQAKMVGKKRITLFPVPKEKADTHPTLEIDPQTIPLEEKEDLIRRYNQIILSAPKVQTSRTIYRDLRVNQYIATNEGTLIRQEKIYTGALLRATAKEGTNVQQAFETVGQAKGFEVVKGLEEKAEGVARDAVGLLTAPKVTPGLYTVILDPKLAGVFTHEAFGHLSEADFLSENPVFKEKMKLGRKFAPDELSIVDDGTLQGENGYYGFDDEGVPSQRTYLIKDGILVGRLHSRETAALMREEPTGNARAISYLFPPIVRMSNTFIEPRDYELERMISEVKDGIYAVDVLGGNTDLEMFTFSAQKAYRIVKGKIKGMIRDVILSGNVFDTLKRIDAIGNDLSLFGGLGGCGKGRQSPLPVSDGSPHLRIRGVLIG